MSHKLFTKRSIEKDIAFRSVASTVLIVSKPNEYGNMIHYFRDHWNVPNEVYYTSLQRAKTLTADEIEKEAIEFYKGANNV